MTTSVDTLLQHIGQAVADQLPPTWRKAQVRAVFEDSVVSGIGHVWSTTDVSSESFPVPGKILRLLGDLRRALTPEGKPRPAGLTLSLDRDGAFKLNIDQDPAGPTASTQVG